MKNIKKILIAVEFDDDSNTVIEYGITLGIMLDASVRVIHISRPIANRIIYDLDGELIDEFKDVDSEIDDLDEDAMEVMEENDLQTLKTIVGKVLHDMDLDHHPISIGVSADFAVTGIINEAEKINADLIIVGGHVDFRHKDRSISNLSKEIINRTTRSVLVVPSSYGNRNLDHICMFVNFEFGELTMIKDMIEMAIETNVNLSFVHILDKDEKLVEINQKLEVYNRLFLNLENNHLVSFKVMNGNITDVINKLVLNLDVDLFGINTKKKHWSLFGFQKSFNNQVMKQFKVPIYIWRHQK